MEESIDVFLSYAHTHKDRILLGELLQQLAPLKRQKFIGVWHDSEISAGTDWQQAITLHLNTAHLILLLISPAFMDSDYCYSQEMTRAVERHDAGEARVIPIILRPVDWHGAPFGRLQPLPPDGKPVTRWSNRDDAFLAIVQGIRTSVKELRVNFQENGSASISKPLNTMPTARRDVGAVDIARKVEEVPPGTTKINRITSPLSKDLMVLTTDQLYSLFKFLTIGQDTSISFSKRRLLKEIPKIVDDNVTVVNKIRRFTAQQELANVLVGGSTMVMPSDDNTTKLLKYMSCLYALSKEDKEYIRMLLKVFNLGRGQNEKKPRYFQDLAELMLDQSIFDRVIDYAKELLPTQTFTTFRVSIGASQQEALVKEFMKSLPEGCLHPTSSTQTDLNQFFGKPEFSRYFVVMHEGTDELVGIFSIKDYVLNKNENDGKAQDTPVTELSGFNDDPETIKENDTMNHAQKLFNKNEKITFLFVVNDAKHPVGLLGKKELESWESSNLG